MAAPSGGHEQDAIHTGRPELARDLRPMRLAELTAVPLPAVEKKNGYTPLMTPSRSRERTMLSGMA